ncbi:MAG: ABC transporter ATP-binding protein [Tissierellia bacterium]|nr:ABC transporter ATP-binding protein [Tissierellia bacterium]
MRGGMGGRLRSEVDDQFKLKDLNKKALYILKDNIKSEKKELIYAVLLTLIIAGTHVLLPILTKIAIDDYISTKEFNGLAIVVAGYIALALVQWFASYKQTFLASKIGYTVLYSIRKKLYKHLINLDIDFHNKHQVGDITSVIMNDVEAIYSLISQGFIYLISDAVTLVAIAAALFVLNLRLAVTLLITIPLILYSTKLIGKILRKAQRDVRENIAQLTSGVEQNLSGIKTVKSFSGELNQTSKVSELSEKTRNAQIKAVAISALHFPIMDLAGAIGLALIIWQGGMLLTQNIITLGILMAAVSYVRRIFGPLMDLSQIYTTYQTAGASLDRINSFLDNKQQVKFLAEGEKPEDNYDIAISNLTFGYDQDAIILENVDLDIKQGSHIGIIGKSGSGKSTFIKVLGRQYDPNEGEILIGGVPYQNYSKNEFKKILQILPQDTYLFPLTIWENITYGLKDKALDDVEELISKLELEDFFAKFENGLETKVGEEGKSLSGGQKQAVAIARAMIRDPDILILDEAASNLDSQIEKKIYKYIKTDWAEKTLIIVTHRVTSLDLTDKIYEVRDKGIFEINKDEIELAGWDRVTSEE